MQTSNNHLAATVNSKISSSGMWIVAFRVIDCCCWVVDLWAIAIAAIDCCCCSRWMVACCGHWMVAVAIIGWWLLPSLDGGCCRHWMMAVAVVGWWLLLLLDGGCCHHWTVAVAIVGWWLLPSLDGGCCRCWMVAVAVIGWWLLLSLDGGCCRHWRVAVAVVGWWRLRSLDGGCCRRWMVAVAVVGWWRLRLLDGGCCHHRGHGIVAVVVPKLATINRLPTGFLVAQQGIFLFKATINWLFIAVQCCCWLRKSGMRQRRTSRGKNFKIISNNQLALCDGAKTVVLPTAVMWQSQITTQG